MNDFGHNMKRLILKEELVLRVWGDTHVDPMHILHFKAKITALVRAVRADERELSPLT